MQEKEVQTSQTARKKWSEPEVRELDVRETAFRSGGGADGEARYADCTMS